MPLQAYRAAGSHVRNNLWLWIAVFGAITTLTGLMRFNVGHASIWGDVMAFSGMVTGILVIMQSQVGFVSQHAEPDDEDELPAQG
jgi:hypothetical protein